MVNDLLPLVRNEKFQSVYKKLILSEFLDEMDKSYLLSCSILFLSEYLSDRRKKRLFDVGYYIVLKYSTEYEDYSPLYDVSVNFGFFPISSYINKENLIDGVDQFYVGYKTRSFSRNGIVETLEQRESRDSLLNSNYKDKVFVAPTSYGKSSFILDIISDVRNENVNIAVIVPTKSLLSQTYRSLASNILNRKIIFHDEMYDGEAGFVGVLTQERALRLIGDHSVSFDIIIIDEAHNIFGKDHRSILLTRLLRKNRKRNPLSKFYYLSPLIGDPSNVRYSEAQVVDSYVIGRNMKEPEIFEYKTDGLSYRYDKFCNEFHSLSKYKNYFEYIFENQGDKNFIYLRRPIKIQEFSADLFNELPINEDIHSELLEISETIAKNVHSDFYCVEYVKKGVVYLHGQLPDILKEYMEYKFKASSNLKYMVANSVVLEGVNFPVDRLYILNTHALTGKDLVNLIGRVNRLNMVFLEAGHSLNKLLPKVHFVNSDKYSGRENMANKIKLLRSPISRDEVNNPTLVSYMSGYTEGVSEDGKSVADEKDLKVLETENFLVDNDQSEENSLKVAFIEAGLEGLYFDSEKAFDVIVGRVSNMSGFEFTNGLEDLVDLIYEVLIRGNEDNISDFTILRLRNEKARNFYKMFIAKVHRFNLRQLIDDFVFYFNKIRFKKDEKIFFIGPSFGEISKERPDGSPGKKVYVDLSKKSQKALSNLALVKIKMESDFLSYKLNEYVKFLYSAGVIGQDKYERFVYGSENRIGSKLAQLGISGSSINKIDDDGMLSELKLDGYGRLNATEKFTSYLINQDDLFQFEIGKYLDR